MTLHLTNLYFDLKKIKLPVLSHFYNRENTSTFQDSSYLQRGREGEGSGEGIKCVRGEETNFDIMFL